MRRRGAVAVMVVVLGLLVWWSVGDRAQEPARPAAVERARPTARPRPAARPATPKPPSTPRPPVHAADGTVTIHIPTDTAADEVADVTVRVVDPRGQRTRFRPRCQGAVNEPAEQVSDTTTVWRFTAKPGPCRVQAFRSDGALPTWTEDVELELVGGETYEVDLVLPSERTGGLGVSFEAASDGMRVIRILPGSPAELLGLEPGDVIVEVDGLPAAALSAVEFQQVLAGPEGTAVAFVVDHDDGEEPAVYDLVRTYVPPYR